MSIPSRVQAGQYGSTNPAGRRRAVPQPVVLVKGAAQGREHTDSRSLDSVQQLLGNAIAAIKASPLAECNLIQNITLSSGSPLVVKHGLGRPFVSCLLCGASAQCTISVRRPSPQERPATQQNALDAMQIVITPSNSCTADLLVW